MLKGHRVLILLFFEIKGWIGMNVAVDNPRKQLGVTERDRVSCDPKPAISVSRHRSVYQIYQRR